MAFSTLFKNKKPIIGCIHLYPLPGAPLYTGGLEQVYSTALKEASMLEKNGVDGLIIENFRDMPFYKDVVPAETIATMAAVSREVVNNVSIPVGINVLRNDAHAALAIATAINADFIRVNVHMHGALTDQGIIEGKAYDTMRLKATLKSPVLVFADVGVKHAAPLADYSLEEQAHDLEERGLVDALIVSGTHTGGETDVDDILTVKKATSLPVIVGSGTTRENNAEMLTQSDGCIVGSTFKKEGNCMNDVSSARIKSFMDSIT
ncbi:BtpA/SgcQ family protein [Patescibacteria group bacterium]|nr:BtpA/SgcQ family protein [Patescibacteria group bacterium]